VALADGQVVVLDPVKGVALAQWQFAPGSGALALSLDGETLYVAAGQDEGAEVLAVDTATGEIGDRFGVPGVYTIAAMYDDRALIVAGSAEIAEIVLATGAINTLPGDAQVVAITPSWKHNLALVTAQAEVSVVYLPDKHAPHSTELPGAALFAIDNRSGTRLFVIVAGSAEILVLDTEMFDTTETVPLESIAPEDARVAPSPDGALLYLLDTSTARLTAIDLATKREVAAVNIEGDAEHVGVSSDGERIIVTATTGDGGRTVVFNPALQPLGSLDLDAAPIGLVVAR
jgi:DNA-binding beta-propeller fold protein YncE